MKTYGLKTVQKFFPAVNTIVDAKSDVAIHVTDKDAKPEGKKKHTDCALAVACKRQRGADGVIISISTGYLVKGKRATRYILRSHVGREIVSFDRGAGFSPGIYVMNAPSPSHRLGERPKRQKRNGATGGGHRTPKSKRPRLSTTGIRAVLGSRLSA